MHIYLFTSSEDLPEVLTLALVEVMDHVASLPKTSRIKDSTGYPDQMSDCKGYLAVPDIRL